MTLHQQTLNAQRSLQQQLNQIAEQQIASVPVRRKRAKCPDLSVSTLSTLMLYVLNVCPSTIFVKPTRR